MNILFDLLPFTEDLKEENKDFIYALLGIAICYKIFDIIVEHRKESTNDT